MKNLLKLLVLSLLFHSCGDFEPVYYDESQVGIGFTEGSNNVTVNESGATITIPVEATNITDSDRSFAVSVDTEQEIDPEMTTPDTSSNYTVGTITIPAGEFEGNLVVTLGNYDNLPDLVTQKLVIDLALPSGVGVIGSNTTEINYIKAVICNDLTLTINDDRYGSERTWEVVDASGTVVQSGGPYTDVVGGQQHVINFSLIDGCYTLTMYDSFSDGQVDGSVTGNYKLTCSVITHAEGSGNWGASDSTDFCVNL